MSKLIAVVAAILVVLPTLAHTSTAKREKPVVVASRPEYDIRNLKPIGGDESTPVDFDRSIFVERPAAAQTPLTESSSPPPPPSPGLPIGQTGYDHQHSGSQGYQIARLAGADVVHFVWTDIDQLACHWCGLWDNRYVSYNSYNIPSTLLLQGFDGQFVGLGLDSRSGYTNIDVNSANRAHVTLHQREDISLPLSPWHLYFPIVGNVSHNDSSLSGFASEGCPEVFWPRIAASRDAASSVHILAHSNTNNCSTNLLWYWRFNGSAWTGPVIVDSTQKISYVLADDATSGKVAIVVNVDNLASMNGLNNVAYLESTTDGAGWIAGTEPKVKTVITNYSDPLGPQAWLHISTAYDNGGTLHVVWDEQRFANDSGQAEIKHWNSSRQTVRTVAQGYWPTPYSSGVFNLNLAKITLGIGDGGTTCNGQANDNYLYVVYTRFGGPTPAEQADHSALGFYNGELYLNSSNDGGLSWSPPRNLTNTKTPNCNPGPPDAGSTAPPRPDSVCRSEHWATIGQAVSDIDILFISDKDAGGIPLGEGTWQLNPVVYLRLPGGTANAPYVCPILGPQYTSAFSLASGPCGTEVAPGGSVATTLSIGNFGNATLSGQASVVYTNPASPPTQWLTIAGAQSLPISIPIGDPDLNLSVVLNSAGLPSGLYEAEIHIAHNDTTQGGTEIYPLSFGISPCACQADPVCDAATDVLDVVAVINRAFRGVNATVESGCPYGPPDIDGTTDVDCSGTTNVVDVVKMIDVAFRGADPNVKFCSPCLP